MLASEQGSADTINGELAALSEIFGDNPDMVKILNAPTISAEEKTEFIDKVFKGKISEITYNFVRLITDRKRAAFVPAISQLFNEQINAQKNIVEIRVTSASPLNESQRSKLKARLESSYKKTVVLKEAVDPEIMGGIIIGYGNTLLDGSVRTKLDVIRKQLINTIA